MINIIKKHWIMLLVAIVVALLFISPKITIISKIGISNFQGVFPVLVDDEEYYLAIIKDFSEGHKRLGNAYLFEHKDDQQVFPALAHRIMAKFSNILGISVPFFSLISAFFLSFIGVLVFYILILELTKNKIISFFAPILFYFIFFRELSRPINQQLSFILLVFGVWLVWKIFIMENNFKKTVLYNSIFGVIFGLLLHIFPFFWTSLIVFYSFSLAIKFFLKKETRSIFNNIIPFALFASPFVVVYVINIWRVSASVFYAETMSRWGLLSIHWPGAFFNISYIFISFFVLWINRNNIANKRILLFGYSLLFGGVVLNWQNIITGKYLQFSSHYYQMTVFICFLVIVTSINFIKINFTNKKNIIETGFTLAFSLFFVVVIINRQINGTINTIWPKISKDKIVELQKMNDVFSWFNQYTKKDSVIYVLGDNYETYLPIYTHNNLYSASYVGNFLISDNEIEDRWIRQNILTTNLEKIRIATSDGRFWNNKFIDSYQNKMVRRRIKAWFGINDQEPIIVPVVYKERVLNRYDKLKKENIETVLKKYRINYILLDRKNENYKQIEVKLKKEKFLEPVKEFDDVIIFKVN